MSENWQGQRVVILGAARQGLALARYLSLRGAQVVLNDNRPASEFAAGRKDLADLPVTWVLGEHPLRLLDSTDRLFVSGGVPLTLPIVQEALKRHIPLSNDTQVFLEAVPCRVVGITGSAGKTTTTTLVGRMAEAVAGKPGGPRRAWVGGNIGNPLINQLEEMQPGDLVILELSSFQLELTTTSPQVAALLNITPNHLDRHASMEVYTTAKARILQFQGSQDMAVLNREDPGAWGLASKVQGQLMTFGLAKPGAGLMGTYLEKDTISYSDGSSTQGIMPVQINRLRGEHNLVNVLAACTIALAAGLPVEALRKGLEGFTGVPHRLELVRVWKGISWYNDSIATAPERAIAAIHSFDEPLVLLAGGRDKKLPWDAWAHLVHLRVDHLILFGEAAPIILQAVEAARPGAGTLTVHSCAHLKEAVQVAAGIAQKGDVVLLSPGGTSFDEFIDFEERGERYRQWVKELS